MIDLTKVQSDGGFGNAIEFSPTARLTRFGLEPGRMTIATVGTDGWPVVIGPEGRDGQSATLWLLGQFGGQWYATGAERLRKYQLNDVKPVADPNQGGLSTLVGKGWLFDPGRWRVMHGWNPQPGELVGVFISAGSTRSDWVVVKAERTQVMLFRWPGPSGDPDIRPVWSEVVGAPETGVDPHAGGGVEDPGPTDNRAVLDRLDRLDAAVSGLADAIALLAGRPDLEYVGETVIPFPWGSRPTTVVLKPRR